MSENNMEKKEQPINVLRNNIDNVVRLTDDQVKFIAKEMDEAIIGTTAEEIAQFPSNNGVEETDPATREDGELRLVNTRIDSVTGETKILGESITDDETFEEMCERIANSDFEDNSNIKPISESELVNYINNSSSDDSMLKDLSKDLELNPNAIKKLLEITNRKISKEEFNVYKEFPDEVRKMVDDYITTNGVMISSPDGKRIRNFISEQLISEFITNITMDNVSKDFNKELEDIFKKGSGEIADSVIGYTEERNEKYREYANNIEDEEKKKQINTVLDQIDEACNLTTLKEFAKNCKIKKFDLEKPERHFDGLLRNYENSQYNIYDFELAINSLIRNINSGLEEDKYKLHDIVAFFVCFCKQCLNMHPENPTEHAYMYYVLYNVVLSDMNKGERKDVSEKFLENIREVMDNIRIRNNF